MPQLVALLVKGSPDLGSWKAASVERQCAGLAARAPGDGRRSETIEETVHPVILEPRHAAQPPGAREDRVFHHCRFRKLLEQIVADVRICQESAGEEKVLAFRDAPSEHALEAGHHQALAEAVVEGLVGVSLLLEVDEVRFCEYGASGGDHGRPLVDGDIPKAVEVEPETRHLFVEERPGACGACRVGLVGEDAAPSVEVNELDLFRANDQEILPGISACNVGYLCQQAVRSPTEEVFVLDGSGVAQ